MRKKQVLEVQGVEQSTLTSMVSLDLPLFPLDDQLRSLDRYFFYDKLPGSDYLIKMNGDQYLQRCLLHSLKSEEWICAGVIDFVVLALTAKEDGKSCCFSWRKIESCKEFFRTLYTFIYLLGTYLKPHVALLNGITMGGGGGVSIPGTFRIATDKTVFATPETLIGFHPDAGASFYLSHLPGHMGEYLALTGGKLNGVEMVACGLATHYSHSERLPLIEEQLGKLITDDPSVVESTLEKFGDLVYPDRMAVIHRIETVDKCFCFGTVEEIMDALESEASKTNDMWCTSTLKNLKEASPLSLTVSLRSIREGRFQTIDQCIVREYRMSLQGISKQISNDFCEGVRAKMVDKDFAPKWDPPSLKQVSNDMVDQYFSPLSEFEPELELPTKVREAFT